MKKLFLIISLVSFPLISHGDDEHDTSDYQFWNRVSLRLNRQCDRIENGINNGSLTRREARTLQYQQRNIRHRADHLRYHYRISDYDKNELLHNLEESSENIYRLKHNDFYVQNGHNQYSNFYQPDTYQQNISRSSNNDSTGFYVWF